LPTLILLDPAHQNPNYRVKMASKLPRCLILANWKPLSYFLNRLYVAARIDKRR